MTTSEISSWGITVIACIGAVASALYGFKNNSSSVKNDIIATYEKRMGLMEEDLEKLKTDLAQVKTLLEKSEADRKAAEAILQGRNPELEKYMTITLQMLTDIHGAVMPQTVSHNV